MITHWFTTDFRWLPLADETSGSPPSGLPSYWYLIIPILLAWVLFIIPDKRKQNEAKRLAGLKKNDRIVTIGGIHGVVSSAPEGSKEIVIRVEEGMKLKISRTAVATILADEETTEKKQT
jgi:preprotein translocase subunit YajC